MTDKAQELEPWFRPPSQSDDIQTVHSSSAALDNQQRAIIVGAGLAGCCSAWALANRGWKVTLLDASTQLASAASSNRLALFRPHITREPSTASEFSVTGFKHMQALLNESCSQQGESIDFNCDGVLQLLHNAEAYPDSPLYQRLTKQQAQALTGLRIASGGLFFDTAGQVNVPSLCRWLTNSRDIDFHAQCQVLTISRHQNFWRLNCNTSTFDAAHVVLANGTELANFTDTRELTLIPVRGQTSVVNAPASKIPVNLKVAVCGKHSIIPLAEKTNAKTKTDPAQTAKQQWQLGATYQRDSTDDAISDHDDRENVTAANSLFEESLFDASDEPVLQSWAGVRATTPDRLPLCGPIPDFGFYHQAYADIHHGRPATNYPDARYQPGLYVIGGFGSRGVSVAAHCASVLANLMTKKVANRSADPTDAKTLRLLHPARFLIRRLRKQPA